MVPSPWVGLILALAAFRLVRLIGWDDLPPIARLRARVTRQGGYWADETRWQVTYDRPLLAEFLHCPFCVGFHVSAVVYVAWLLAPTGTLYGAAPFALSAAVGLVAKNLDP